MNYTNYGSLDFQLDFILCACKHLPPKRYYKSIKLFLWFPLILAQSTSWWHPLFQVELSMRLLANSLLRFKLISPPTANSWPNQQAGDTGSCYHWSHHSDYALWCMCDFQDWLNKIRNPVAVKTMYVYADQLCWDFCVEFCFTIKSCVYSCVLNTEWKYGMCELAANITYVPCENYQLCLLFQESFLSSVLGNLWFKVEL